jgi:hypothetical protein
VTGAELEDLVRRFAERSLPKAEWTHAAHLAVGLWHVSRYGRDEALACRQASPAELLFARALGIGRGASWVGRARPGAAPVSFFLAGV